MRVRISGDTLSPFFVHSTSTNHGGSYYLPDSRGFLARSTHHMTVITPSGSSLGMISPSLHATSALFHGCSGRLCGFRFPTSNGQSQVLEEQRMMSSIGASSAIGTTLRGHVYNVDGSLARIIFNTTVNYVNYFAIDEDSMSEITIPPYGSTKIGPIYFRPPSRGYYNGFLKLENSLTG